MKRFLYLIATCFSFTCIHSQGNNSEAVISSENTFALVVGIANYENDRLNLNYSNRDAEEFAAYLSSRAGGLIPGDNIRLLTDTNATTAAIYNSFKWLKKKTELAKAQDESARCMVYIYFSGHGDVETNTRANLGFLLAFNTPPNNYLNNAVRIEDLNDYAHTLAVDMNANVIIITDACHSGKLAGSDFRGTYLAGTALATAREKEIRIASCNPDELSMEDERWGNGRGVFSYYLLNGLKGLADRNGDHIVTLNEARQYVDSSIAADPVLKELKHKQTPVVQGNNQFRLSAYNPEDMPVPPVTMGMESLPPAQQFWKKINDLVADISQLNFNSLQRQNASTLPFAFLNELKKMTAEDPDAGDLILSLKTQLKKDPAQLQQFRDKLLEWMHTRGQEVINQYLAGDAATLEKRRYYNVSSAGYDMYPALYGTALLLADKNDPLYRILLLNKYYFSGLAVRLRLPLTRESQQPAMLGKALQAQLKALELDDNAAFVQNELGVLYQYKNELQKAEQYFIHATALAPSWAIPQANLAGLYTLLNDTAKAAAAVTEAEKLQPDLQNTQVNAGSVEELKGNYLFAEERYREAININSRHYFPFERLADIYLRTTSYAEADSFYYEAEKRKKGYHFNKNNPLIVFGKLVDTPAMPFICQLDTAILQQDDIMAFFYWGLDYYNMGDHMNAIRVLSKIVQLDPANPLVFHYLGKIYYDDGQWEQGEIMFDMAVKNYLSGAAFIKYADSLVKGRNYVYDHSCFENFFRMKHYYKLQDNFLLGSLYEKWKHFDEAEQWYRSAIEAAPDDLAGYIKVWQLLETQGRFHETESVILSYRAKNQVKTDRELGSFYRRAIEHAPEQAEWYHKLGLLLYTYAQAPNKVRYLDTIIWFPSINKEVFIDESSYKFLGKGDLSLDLNDGNVPEIFRLVPYRDNSAAVYIHGTEETIPLTEPFYTPRKDAVYYLKMADSLISDVQERGAIQFMIGNVFVWSGSRKQAFPWYVSSVELQPDNANARMNLVDVSKAIYKHREGLKQLTYLYDSAQISFALRILYGDWSILAGDFDRAKKILKEATDIYPYPVPAYFELIGKTHLLRNENKEAIYWYKQYALLKEKDAGTAYSLARLHAMTGKQADALKWLDLAFQYGFRYGYVLNADAAWNNLRKNLAWANLVKKYTMKKYLHLSQE